MDNEEINGLLVINKPEGISTEEITQIIKEKLKLKKVGYVIPLDSFTSGIVLFCVNRGTRLIEFLRHYDNEYYVEAELGFISDTYDIQGNVKKFIDKSKIEIAKEKIEQILKERFTGEITQRIIPASLIKSIKEKTKKDRIIKKIKQTVIIYKYEDIEFKNGKLKLRVQLNKRGDVRSIINDLGVYLQTGAIVTKLVKIKSGPYSINDTVTIDKVSLNDIIDFNEILKEIDTYQVEGITLKRIINGTKVLSSYIFKNDNKPSSRIIRIEDKNNKFLAVAKISRSTKYISPEKVFLFQLTKEEITALNSLKEVVSNEQQESNKEEIK